MTIVENEKYCIIIQSRNVLRSMFLKLDEVVYRIFFSIDVMSLLLSNFAFPKQVECKGLVGK